MNACSNGRDSASIPLGRELNELFWNCWQHGSTCWGYVDGRNDAAEESTATIDGDVIGRPSNSQVWNRERETRHQKNERSKASSDRSWGQPLAMIFDR